MLWVVYRGVIADEAQDLSGPTICSC